MKRTEIERWEEEEEKHEKEIFKKKKNLKIVGILRFQREKKRASENKAIDSIKQKGHVGLYWPC